MNQGQKKFYEFAIERVQSGKETEMQAIMRECFKRQDKGTFTKEYMAEVMPKIISLLRPECVEEFKQAAAHMSSTLKQ